VLRAGSRCAPPSLSQTARLHCCTCFRLARGSYTVVTASAVTTSKGPAMMGAGSPTLKSGPAARSIGAQQVPAKLGFRSARTESSLTHGASRDEMPIVEEDSNGRQHPPGHGDTGA
jgi:hypothetical protein